MLEIIKYSELDSDIINTLEFYIEKEFGHIQLVQQTQWSNPNWTLFWLVDNKLVSFCNIVLRDVLIDGKMVEVAGLNNVITPKEHRGNKYSSILLGAFESFIFNDLDLTAGVLLCSDDLVPFYKKLNWYTVECPVYFEQPIGKKQWEANIMFLTKGNRLNPTSIDLNGLPW